MSYELAMEAAGAEVLAFQCFGSYQGDWWAKVSYQGQEFWIHGNYGSCSGCDAFQSEFDYGDDEHCEEHRYEYGFDATKCAACQEAILIYKTKLKEFGERYIFSNEFTQEEAEREATGEPDSYDYDEKQEQLEFIKSNAIGG